MRFQQQILRWSGFEVIVETSVIRPKYEIVLSSFSKSQYDDILQTYLAFLLGSLCPPFGIVHCEHDLPKAVICQSWELPVASNECGKLQ